MPMNHTKNSLERIKEIAQEMPDGEEKTKAMQAYENLKLFEVIADSFVLLLKDMNYG